MVGVDNYEEAISSEAASLSFSGMNNATMMAETTSSFLWSHTRPSWDPHNYGTLSRKYRSAVTRGALKYGSWNDMVIHYTRNNGLEILYADRGVVRCLSQYTV